LDAADFVCGVLSKAARIFRLLDPVSGRWEVLRKGPSRLHQYTIASGGAELGTKVQKRDIIVIGGSAGGIDACCEVLQGLPGDFPAAVFIVQHIGPASELAQVFNRCGSLQVIAVDTPLRQVSV
jgi:chemotaxis response regulator CheB